MNFREASGAWHLSAKVALVGVMVAVLVLSTGGCRAPGGHRSLKPTVPGQPTSGRVDRTASLNDTAPPRDPTVWAQLTD